MDNCYKSKLRPDIRIVTVIHDPNLTGMAKNAGTDVIIPASVTVGHLLALSAVMKDMVGVVFSEKIGRRRLLNSQSSNPPH